MRGFFVWIALFNVTLARPASGALATAACKAIQKR